MTPKELEQTIRSLLLRPSADVELREQLEKLAAAEVSFSGFTWLFGPDLYRRNRILFRPFILSRFSTYMVLPKWKVQPIVWKEKAKILDSWLAEVDQNDDADLFRRLYEWKLSGVFDWRKRDARAKQIMADLLARFQSAATPARSLQLLHLVERSPASWEAIRYMPDTDRTFREFLWRWKEKCPEAQKAFVEEVANTFGIPGWS